jgi:hypothetical protein
MENQSISPNAGGVVTELGAQMTATLYIAEFPTFSNDTTAGGGLPFAKWPPLAFQALAFSGEPANSAAFNASTRVIRVHTDTACSLLIGPLTPAGNNQVPDDTCPRLAANETQYFGVSPGDYISVVT